MRLLLIAGVALATLAGPVAAIQVDAGARGVVQAVAPADLANHGSAARDGRLEGERKVLVGFGEGRARMYGA